MKNYIISLLITLFLTSHIYAQSTTDGSIKPFIPPVSFEEAKKRANVYLDKLTLKEKIKFINGFHLFYIRGFKKYKMPRLYLSDATQGIHIRSIIKSSLKKSVAFPCPLALASTWNTELAGRYAQCIGEECRAGDVAFLLGPGMNMYRISQCGRNFEYFGEDPYLTSRLVENYITGMQSTGTIATMKHFLCNNTDFHRKNTNSVVDERALHEIYLPAFKAGVDAGVLAVMTSYNQVNGEWTGQSKDVIDGLLKHELGFKWLVMTDWWSVNNTEKVIRSGQDLVMPGHSFIKKDAKRLLKEGKITESEINRMCKSIIQTCIAMGLYDRPVTDKRYIRNFGVHEETALQTAREAVVLLKNNDHILPLSKHKPGKIVLCGDYATKIACGGGSASVKGYHRITLLKAMQNEFGDQLAYIKNPSDEQIKNAEIVIFSTGTMDNEGYDRPFELPAETDTKISRYSDLNPNTIIIINSGSGVQMTNWDGKVKAILYSWYLGQNGSTAIAEILSGKTNPSGKLPISIERKFTDSPGYPYIPKGEKLYKGWRGDFFIKGKMFDINYKESIFTGYRWYETKKIEPLYPFGFGLSYTQFIYSNLQSSKIIAHSDDTLSVSLTLRNTGDFSGSEVVQLYIQDIESSVPRPVKELKGFSKVFLNRGESRLIVFKLSKNDFSFWNPDTGNWQVEPGDFNILLGSSSKDIRQVCKISIVN